MGPYHLSSSSVSNLFNLFSNMEFQIPLSKIPEIDAIPCSKVEINNTLVQIVMLFCNIVF